MLIIAVPLAVGGGGQDYRRTQVYVHPSFQVTRYMGALNADTGWGVGMGFTQGIQFGWIGFNLTVDTDFFLTNQSAPPFNTGFQQATVRAAGRFLAPVWDLRLFSEISAQRLSFISNALVEITGDRLAFHGVGGALGARYMGMQPIYFEIRADADYLIDLDQTWGIGIGVAIGLRSLL